MGITTTDNEGFGLNTASRPDSFTDQFGGTSSQPDSCRRVRSRCLSESVIDCPGNTISIQRTADKDMEDTPVNESGAFDAERVQPLVWVWQGERIFHARTGRVRAVAAERAIDIQLMRICPFPMSENP